MSGVTPDPEGAAAELARAEHLLERSETELTECSTAYDSDPTEGRRIEYRAALERWRDRSRGMKAAEDLCLTYQLVELDAAQVEFLNRFRVDREQDAQKAERMIELLDRLGEARRRLG